MPVAAHAVMRKGAMTMNATEPQTLNELLRLAERLRPQIVRLANGVRWCWIAEWRSDNQKYEFGVKVEGQTTWQQYGTLSRPHHEWIARLNQLEGILPEAHLAIWMSGQQQAKACVSEDETDVVLILRGTIVRHEASTGCYVFTLEGDKATDLFSCLFSILTSPTKVYSAVTCLTLWIYVI